MHKEEVTMDFFEKDFEVTLVHEWEAFDAPKNSKFITLPQMKCKHCEIRITWNDKELLALGVPGLDFWQSQVCPKRHESKMVFYTFTVDKKEFKSVQPFLTGINIKSISKTDGSHSLYLMESGETPDLHIGESTTVNIINRSFFTIPPAVIYG